MKYAVTTRFRGQKSYCRNNSETIPMQPTPARSARTRTLAFAVCLFIFSVLRIQAAAPPGNDTCAGAVNVPGNGPFPYLTPIIDISGATISGDPTNEVVGQTNLGFSVWYSFTPSVGGHYTLSVGQDTATDIVGLSIDDEDTLMAVYTSSGGCAGNFTLFLEDDDSAAPLRSAVSSPDFQAGTTYYVVVWVGPISLPLITNQVINLQMKVSKPTAVTNDSCIGAQVIPTGAPFPYLTGLTDNTLATNNLVPTCAPQPQDGVPSRDVWYEFIPPTSGTYIFSTGADTATTVNDTLLAIYSSPSPCGTLTSVVCNNNTSGRAVVAQALTAGTRYYIVVWDNDADPIPGSTLVQLRVSLAAAPSVSTMTAANISSTGALLKGTVNPNGLQSRYWFEWGPTAGLGSTSQVRLLLGGTTTLPAEVTVSTTSLTANAPYHYRLVSTNLLGRTVGSTQTFVWSNTRPNLGSPDLLASGAFRFMFNNGNPGQLYMIQGATDLGVPSPWTDLGLATNLSSTLFQFTHTGAGAAPYRFYRVRLP